MESQEVNLNNIKPEIVLPQSASQLVETLKQNNWFNLSNGEKITINEIYEWFDDACDKLIVKYGFNQKASEIFKSNISIRPCNTRLGGDRGMCTSNIRKFSDGQLKPICAIDINPNSIHNKLLYKAVLIHELDHHAFVVKTFLNSKLYQCNLSSQYNEQTAHEEFNIQTHSPSWAFSTELLARIDTADELMKMGIPRNEIWEYGLCECETTGDQSYDDCVKYAQKFVSFQIGLYNALGKAFGRDRSKPINQQLFKEVEKEFKDIMTHLRIIIFNCSIESTKKAIDAICHNFKESTSREQFKSSIQRIYSDITR